VIQPNSRLDRMYQRLTFWHALAIVALAGVLLVLVEAVLMRIVEPETFDRFGLALWFAAVTVGTVGYGDVVPETDDGRAVATIGIIFGLAWVPVVAAIVVSALVSRVQRQARQADRETFRAMEERLARIEAHLERRAGDGYDPSRPDRGPDSS
jgi:voltage-gated potassium channel Kch